MVDPWLDQQMNHQKLEFQVEMQESSHKIPERPEASHTRKVFSEKSNFGRLSYMPIYTQPKVIVLI